MSTQQNVELPVLTEQQVRAAGGFTTIFDRSNLTKSQFLIWTGQKLNPDVPLYNMALAFTIQGSIDPQVFHVAFEAMIMQTDAMRTVIGEIDGIPQQRVLDGVPTRTLWVDISSSSDPEAEYEQWLDHRRSQVLRLESCLYDSVLIKLGDQRYVWYLNQHHLITDGWATALVYRRMVDFYHRARQERLGDGSTTPPLPQFSEYREYEREFRESSQLAKAADYWKQKLADDVDPLVFYGRSEPAVSSSTLRVPCDLGRERTDRLKAIAKEKGVRSLTDDLSLFNVFMTVLFATLSRVTNSRDLIVGAPSHNRPTPAFKETVGLFIEIQPMCIDVDEDETFDSLLKKVSAETFNLLRHSLPGSSDFAHNNSL